MCLSTHAQSVHVNCVSSRVFYNKNLQGNHRHLYQKVPKSTAISWFQNAKAFQHIVPQLCYAEALTKGSHPKHTVSLDKKPYQRMVPPIFNNKVKKGLNPQAKAFTKFERGLKKCRKQIYNVQGLFNINTETNLKARDQ